MHRFRFSLSSLRRTLRLLPLPVLILISSLATYGQKAPASQSEGMSKLNFLVGEWKGKGWVISWDGSHGDEFSQKTKVQAKADGSILRIKDERRYNTPGVIHTSEHEASIYYEEDAKTYRWRGENSYGRSNPLYADLIDANTFEYGVPSTFTGLLPNGVTRTTIKVTDSGEWNETTEVWKVDRWYKVEESILKKVK